LPLRKGDGPDDECNQDRPPDNEAYVAF